MSKNIQSPKSPKATKSRTPAAVVEPQKSAPAPTPYDRNNICHRGLSESAHTVREVARIVGGHDKPDGFHVWIGDTTQIEAYAKEGSKPYIGPDGKTIKVGADTIMLTPSVIWNQKQGKA